jgi:uncharacterized repeat protein (TIGR03803 family)
VKSANLIPTYPSVILILLCAALAMPAPAQTFTKLADLSSTTGTNTRLPLVQGFDGNFYGTAFYGGAHLWGTVFKVTPSGAVTVLHNFCVKPGINCADGANPNGIALSPGGNFFGTTANVDAKVHPIHGTVYRISPQGSLTTLHTFCTTDCSDGAAPAGLILARNGDFYGISYPPPEQQSLFHNVVFKLSPSGAFTRVLVVCPGQICPTDSGPIEGLRQASGGNLLAVGYHSGATLDLAIETMTLAGTPTLVYDFCIDSDCHDGNGIPSLLQSTGGAFYATFNSGGTGGCREGCGTAVRVSSGSLVKLHDFCCGGGVYPTSLMQATDGNFYGTTDGQTGTVFKLTPSGHVTTLHVFGNADGASPAAALLQATDGNLYGTTMVGGANNDGTIFRISLGLAPFVKTVQNAGKAGASVIILGNNLTGSTSVAFNGTPASFSVISDTEIKATVPAGATTGNIQVVTPGTTLSSNVAFVVLP